MLSMNKLGGSGRKYVDLDKHYDAQRISNSPPSTQPSKLHSKKHDRTKSEDTAVLLSSSDSDSGFSSEPEFDSESESDSHSSSHSHAYPQFHPQLQFQPYHQPGSDVPTRTYTPAVIHNHAYSHTNANPNINVASRFNANSMTANKHYPNSGNVSADPHTPTRSNSVMRSLWGKISTHNHGTATGGRRPRVGKY